MLLFVYFICFVTKETVQQFVGTQKQPERSWWRGSNMGRGSLVVELNDQIDTDI